MNKIVLRKKIELTPAQEKFVKSGWGENIINTETEELTYLSDGMKVNGYLSYPKEINKKLPCIIWCRGGVGEAGVIDNFNARGIFGLIASWGYVVLASQYRGNAGGEGKDDFGGDDLNDILNLTDLSDEIDYIDETKWGIEGWSRGGMMTYLALTKTDIFKAAVITGGIANLRCNSEESTFMRHLYELSMGSPSTEDYKNKCKERSIINFPDKISKNINLLLLHGTADDTVLPHDSIDISYKLIENNINFRLILYENGDHYLKGHRKEADIERKKWYEKYLLD
ncbi:MAG: prolyl oligopeptidase family serine peptidase [Melioribacteraceae bacterium]|nr:prolyl oligopeptidase family serine peptidase [Melioribacteraceae bacterium]